MDKASSPGIAFQKIHLLECSVGKVNAAAKLRFEVGIAEMVRTYNEDKSQMVMTVTFDLMHGIEEPPCKFVCKFSGTYKRPQDASMQWEEFKDHIAIAHLLPFFREFVCNLTMRMPLAGLMIPPINAHRLVEQFKKQSVQPTLN